MYNYLRGRLKQLGYLDRDLCDVLGVTASGVSRRMTNKTPWNIDEMYTLLELCRDKPENMHLYFPKDGRDDLALRIRKEV